MRWLEIRNYRQLILKVRSRREKSLKDMRTIMDEIKTMDTFQTKIDHELLLSLRDLCKSIQLGDVSASYILHAYMEKALEATTKFNCITEFLPECQTQLLELEDKKEGLLYGIPISIKENISLKGHDSTCGLKKFINKPVNEDCVIVQVLKKQGAIPFVKTNVPQSLFSYECSNPIYGQTINPLNIKRTPGGSSGGEAVLIAAGGSILGIGTDVGGSIRFPAAFCGICGFKPTANRLSRRGLTVNTSGQRTVEPSVGPLARDVDSLAYCMKALLCEEMFELDPNVPPVPFDDMIYADTKPLKIGFFESDGYWIPSQSMKRAVLETKQLLEDAGHTLVSFTPPKMFYAMNEIIFQGLLADSGATFLENLKGDIIDPHLRTQVSTYSMPRLMKKLLYFFLKPFSPRVAAGFRATEGIGSVKELWKHHVAVMAYREEYLNAWKHQNIEVLLCPSLGPALNIGYAGKLSAASSYMVIFNLLNFPAGVLPVTKVTEEDEKELMNYTGYQNDIWDRTFRKRQPGDAEFILSLSLQELHEKLQGGILAPDSVLNAYMEKALEVNKQLNCLTDFLPECQDQLQDTQRKRKGLLYGIPISIKDNINCKGHDSTCGLRKFLNWPAIKDSVIVQVLKKQGAIPFVKTNVVQCLLSYECSNSIFGQTVNPLDHKRTPGGSSGGEAALIAAGGSILGIGSDIGGSIRVPASFCGICGFKATGNRISTKGCKVALPGQKAVQGSFGSLARDVDSLALCMKALFSEEMFNLDASVPPLLFNDEVYSSSKPLRIGYYESDGFWIPLACMKRTVMETKQLLEAAGHTLVPFTPLKIPYAFKELVVKNIGADCGTTILENLKGDILDPNVKDILYANIMPHIFKKIMSFLLKPFSPRLADIIRSLCGVGSITELWKLQVEIEAYFDEYINLWKSKKLDVMLCPALGPAFKLGYAGKLSVTSSYKIIFNLLNCPAGVVPVGTVTEKDEEELKDYVGYRNDIWDRTFKKAVADAVGLPLAVQCVALPWQDELCLRFMKEVERVTQKNRGI